MWTLAKKEEGIPPRALTMCLFVFALCSLLLPSNRDALDSQVVDAECPIWRGSYLENDGEYQNHKFPLCFKLLLSKFFQKLKLVHYIPTTFLYKIQNSINFQKPTCSWKVKVMLAAGAGVVVSVEASDILLELRIPLPCCEAEWTQVWKVDKNTRRNWIVLFSSMIQK